MKFHLLTDTHFKRKWDKKGRGKKCVYDSDFTVIPRLISHCCFCLLLQGSGCDNGPIHIVLVQYTARQSMCLTNNCVAPYCMQYMLHVLDMELTEKLQNLSCECNLFLCMCVSCFFHFTISSSSAKHRGKGYSKFQRAKKPASSVLCLPPDVLFSDEFSSLYSAIVIYIGSAWTNEGFFLLNAKTKTEGWESYLQFGASIKMQIVGNHFSAVTMETLSLQRPKTARRMDPPNSTSQIPFFTFKLKHLARSKGIYFMHCCFL